MRKDLNGIPNFPIDLWSIRIPTLLVSGIMEQAWPSKCTRLPHWEPLPFSKKRPRAIQWSSPAINSEVKDLAGFRESLS